MATVLLTDADEARLRRVRSLLRQEGHRTVVASDGTAALEKARELRPALVVAEVEMPGLDGYGLTLTLREELPPDSLRVILLKAEVGAEDRTTASAVGADDLRGHADIGDPLLGAVRRLVATRRPAGGALAGEADQEALFALLQFLHGRRETGSLSVAGAAAGTVLFHQGEVIGARAESHAGMDAFLLLLRNRTGRYCFDRGPVDAAGRNLGRAFDPLLMDAFAALE